MPEMHFTSSTTMANKCQFHPLTHLVNLQAKSTFLTNQMLFQTGLQHTPSCRNLDLQLQLSGGRGDHYARAHSRNSSTHMVSSVSSTMELPSLHTSRVTTPRPPGLKSWALFLLCSHHSLVGLLLTLLLLCIRPGRFRIGSSATYPPLLHGCRCLYLIHCNTDLWADTLICAPMETCGISCTDNFCTEDLAPSSLQKPKDMR